MVAGSEDCSKSSAGVASKKNFLIDVLPAAGGPKNRILLNISNTSNDSQGEIKGWLDVICFFPKIKVCMDE